VHQRGNFETLQAGRLHFPLFRHSRSAMASWWRSFFTSYENLEADKVRFGYCSIKSKMFQTSPQKWSFLEKILCLRVGPIVEKAQRGQIDLDRDLWEVGPE
jgi:hypothetical protein